MLDAADLSFEYGTSRRGRVWTRQQDGVSTPAIDGVSLSVSTGSAVAILGPNGAGKSTLLKLLSGSLTPAAGTITLDGRDLASLPRSLRARHMAVVPQDTHLAFDYTALEIVLMGRYPRLGAFQIEGPDDVRSALDALAATGTRDLASRGFSTLSGGERQRVVIASALAQLDDRDVDRGARKPTSLLFLDEPTASLDLRYQIELAALLRRLHREAGVTIVLSTHDLRLVASVATEVFLLARGRVMASGPPSEVLTSSLIGALYELSDDLVAPLVP
jgi:iron complex transport system ATP-binding protein